MLAPIEGNNLVTEGVITEIDRTTLIDLRDRLRRGEITSHSQPDNPYSYYLDMTNCDHCILGLCYTISGGQAFTGFRGSSFYNPQLTRLFLPIGLTRTPAETEHAITTFLTTGEAEWNEWSYP